MLDDLRTNVRRLALVLMAGFGVVAMALGYWQIVRGADLGEDASNPRVADARSTEPRGRILDRNGVVLADGTPRHYADPSMVHTIGIHSDRFGDTNLEAAYDAELRGERALSPLERFGQVLFHTAPTPNDLVLTVDKRINDAAVQALGDSAGSIVAIDPRTGEILALASTPYFDPNAVDQQLGRPLRPRIAHLTHRDG